MKLVNVHLNTAVEEGERFDTLTAPAGTVATLLEIERQLGIKDAIGVDESYPGREKTREFLHQTIAEHIKRERVAILFTTLIYNAEPTIQLMRELRQEYGHHLHIVVGGQLIPLVKEPYLQNTDVDTVCVGDAEVILPSLLADLDAGSARLLYQGTLQHSGKRRVFAGASYDGFYMLEERMKVQRERAGFSQLLIQGPGGPGCSWAANNPEGPCNFCALQNITTMNEVTLEEHFAREHALQERYHPDRIFDVANQFFPKQKRNEVIQWLTQYIQARNKAGVTTPQYCYLTVSSVDEEVASLLQQAGIQEVYLGIDHFDPKALKEENKPYRSRNTLTRCLDALKKYGIRFRTGVVMGAARETPETLKSIEEGIAWMQREYRGYVRSIGIFPVEVIPGSDVFAKMKASGVRQDIFQSFEAKGYLTREEQHELTKAYIDYHSEVDAEEVYAVAKELEGKTDATLLYTVDHSPGPEVLKKSF